MGRKVAILMEAYFERQNIVVDTLVITGVPWGVGVGVGGGGGVDSNRREGEDGRDICSKVR